MDVTQIIVTVVTCVFGAGGLLITYVKHRMDKAEREARNQREFQQQYTKLVRQLLSCRGRVTYWLVFCAQKNQIPNNGELQALVEAQAEAEEIEKALKQLERDRAVDTMADN